MILCLQISRCLYQVAGCTSVRYIPPADMKTQSSWGNWPYTVADYLVMSTTSEFPHISSYPCLSATISSLDKTVFPQLASENMTIVQLHPLMILALNTFTLRRLIYTYWHLKVILLESRCTRLNFFCRRPKCPMKKRTR